MTRYWPSFSFRLGGESRALAIWRGKVRGLQRAYEIGVLWDAEERAAPYVWLMNPALAPRKGASFEDIPHLLYYEKQPENSGLCLFDPAGNEWSSQDLIAQTTVPWAASWLAYYEFWLLDGVWRGGGVGIESRGAAKRAAIHQQAGELSGN